jgi:hypothetical protein
MRRPADGDRVREGCAHILLGAGPRDIEATLGHEHPQSLARNDEPLAFEFVVRALDGVGVDDELDGLRPIEGMGSPGR